MTIRSLYRRLLGLHPRRLRQRFEEEMLWIFDETRRERGGASLLADACVSLIRQWVMRPESWIADPHVPHQGTSPAAAMVRLAELRRRSQGLYTSIWRLNFVWLVGVLVVHIYVSAKLDPSGYEIAGELVFGGLTCFALYHLCRKGWSGVSSMFRDPRRVQLVRQRDGLWYWSGFIGPVLVAFMSVPLIFALLFRLFGVSRLGEASFWVSVIGFVGLSVFFFLWLRSLGERAAHALQQEMEALDEFEKQR
jgi:hypothetical protein